MYAFYINGGVTMTGTPSPVMLNQSIHIFEKYIEMSKDHIFSNKDTLLEIKGDLETMLINSLKYLEENNYSFFPKRFVETTLQHTENKKVICINTMKREQLEIMTIDDHLVNINLALSNSKTNQLHYFYISRLTYNILSNIGIPMTLMKNKRINLEEIDEELLNILVDNKMIEIDKLYVCLTKKGEIMLRAFPKK